MNLLIFVVFALVLPSAYLSRETFKQGGAPSARDSFVFPKDRKSNPNLRIIGGQEVTPHSYPFQVGLLIYSRVEAYFCGGTLISTRFVLTAAHCVDIYPNPALYVLVQLGAHNITATESNSIVLNATEWVHHKDWNERLLQNDVALIKLPQEVTLNDYIQTVSYTKGNDHYIGVAATAIGWGRTQNAGSVSDVLRSLNTRIMSNAACADTHAALEELVIDSHLCTAGDGLTGTCSGDSGGPLLVDGVQVGIVSFGFTDCLLGLPSVFTRITEFSDWIEENAVDGASTYQNLYYSLIISAVLSLVHLVNSM